MDVPHVIAPAASASPPSAGRFAAHQLSRDAEGCRVALIGLADDTGVGMNGGRLGAADGPRGFRAALAGYGVAEPSPWVWPKVFDAGDVATGASLAETHQRVTEATAALVARGMTPIAIGGGHDLTFPFVRAVAQASETPLVGVYFDAHLDVRDAEGSGMPFRRLIETCGVRKLHVHGLDPMANSREHINWFASHGGHVDPFGPDDEWPAGDVFVSFDLDVIDASAVPGVSAMNPAGWPTPLAMRWAHSAGRCPRVRCFDIMELAPPLDPSGRTARIAAKLFLSFLRGFAERRSA